MNYTPTTYRTFISKGSHDITINYSTYRNYSFKFTHWLKSSVCVCVSACHVWSASAPKKKKKKTESADVKKCKIFVCYFIKALMEKLQGCVQNVEQSTAWSRKPWEETRTLKRKAEKYHALCNLFEGQVWGFTPQQV